MNKFIGLIAIFSFLVPYLSFAQIPPPAQFEPPEIPTRLFSCLPTDPLRICLLRILDDILKVILVIALIFAALMIAWAGITYILRGGSDDNARKEAKARLIYAAIGLVIAFMAWVVTVMLTRFIGGQGQPQI